MFDQPDVHRPVAPPMSAPEGGRTTSRRRHVVTLLRALVAGLLLWVLLSQIDMDGVAHLMISTDPWLLALSFVLTIVRLPFSGARWRMLLERRGYAFSTLYLTKVIFVAQFAASLLPAASGVDLMRGYYLSRRRVDTFAVVETMIADRVAGVLGLIALAVAPAVWVLFNRLALADVSFSVLGLAGAAVAVLLLAPRFPQRTGEGRVGRVPRSTFRLASSLARLVSERGLLARLVLLSMAFQLVGVASVYLLGMSIGAATSVFYYFLFVPLIWLLMAVPISINGIGVREGAFVFYFGLVGMPPEVALTIATLVFAQTVLLGMIAGVHLALSRPDRHDGITC